MKRVISFLVTALTTTFTLAFLTACVTGFPGGEKSVSTTPPAEVSYIPMDYKKWASGMYADEFLGKYVVVEGYFSKNPMGQFMVGSDITFFVHEKSLVQMQQDAQKAARSGKPSTEMFHQHIISIKAPLSMRDQIYQINDQQKVRAYCRVISAHSRSIFTRRVISSSLLVKAERIDVVP